jgi:hypothetical protein
MPFLAGLALAIAVACLARLIGFDRERGFYAVVLIVVASYYVLFAVEGGDRAELHIEAIVFVLFSTAAVVGFRTTLWVVVAALAAHGVYDVFHDALLDGRGVPQWWPEFCLAYDVAAAACLGLLLVVRRTGDHQSVLSSAA